MPSAVSAVGESTRASGSVVSSDSAGSSCCGRVATASRIGTPSIRLARKARKRRDGSSAHCASSTTSTSGRSAARPVTSHASPCSSGRTSSASGRTSVKIGCASRAAPSKAASGAPRTTASSSWCTTPNANFDSSSDPRAFKTRAGVSAACSCSARSRRVLPRPGAASMTSSRPAPPIAAPSASSSVARSASRSMSSSSTARSYAHARLDFQGARPGLSRRARRRPRPRRGRAAPRCAAGS